MVCKYHPSESTSSGFCNEKLPEDMFVSKSTADSDLTDFCHFQVFGGKYRGIQTPATQQYRRTDSKPPYMSIVGMPIMSGSPKPENSVNGSTRVTLSIRPPKTCAPVNVNSHSLTNSLLIFKELENPHTDSEFRVRFLKAGFSFSS